MKLIIKTLAGLEEVLAAELSALGAANVERGIRVVNAEGDQALLYRANLHLRTGLRVLVPVFDFIAKTEEDIYQAVGEVDWSQYLNVDQTLAVDAVTQSQQLNHSHFLALKTKDAVVDQFRRRTGQRPSVDVQRPNVRLHLHIASRGECTISLDSSNDGLHRRGYRTSGGGAPLNEVLAAGLLLLAGYDGTTAFVDPFCGSGTLLIEAALIASRTAPGLGRRFGFERWRDFNGPLWQDIRSQAQAAVQVPRREILGGDISGRALDTAQANLKAAAMQRYVRLRMGPFQKLTPPPAPGLLVTNPPYDLRVQTEDIGQLYQDFGDALKQHYAGYTAWVLSGNPEALKRVGLRPSRRLTLQNGPVEVRFFRYDLYEGSKKVK